MPTNFFQTLSGLQIKGDCKIIIKTGTDGLIVSVLISDDAVGDSAKKLVPPMILKGTPKDMDDGFFEAISKPAIKTAELFSNMESYLAALDEAKRASKMDQDKKDKEKKAVDERAKKFEEQMKKVAELEAKERYGEAIGQMPKADQFPEHAGEIRSRLDELRSKHGQLSLL